MTARPRVLIIGGGLSGLAAAIPLAEEGFQITLLERRPFLGGRASSYPISGNEDSNENQQYVDNCQHILLKSCTNLINFFRRLGVEDRIVYQKRLTFIDENTHQATLKNSFLPVPLHLLPSLLVFPALKIKDKLAIAYAFLCMLREGARSELDQMTMADWLTRHHQTTRSIEAFWRPILVSALNEEIEIASARYGLKTFLDGMLRHREAFHLGVPAVPLSQLYTDPSIKILSTYQAKVQLRSTVSQIEVDQHHIQGIILRDGSKLKAEYYVSTVPPDMLLKLLSQETIQGYKYFSTLHEFETSPITSIYLWFDRKITDLESAALLGTEMQWVFNKNSNNDFYLGLVVSASKKFLPMERSEILEIALRDLRQIFASAREAKLVRSVIIKEPFATFSCRAGCDQLRPDQRSPLENFFVTGDWTKTGWPPTMEGAVRSGYRAAEMIFQAEGIKRTILQADLRKQGLSRFFKF